MRISAILAVLFLVVGTTPGHAFIFLLLAGAGSESGPPPPPVLRELPSLNGNVPVNPGELPAPFLENLNSRDMPRLDEVQTAQVSNEELLRRLEKLEEENRRLRADQQTSGNAPRQGLPGSNLPMQVTSGWWVHLHNWNKDGKLNSPQALKTYRYPVQPFHAATGFREVNWAGDWDELYIFRHEGWLRVTEAGTYQLGAELTCGFNHPCHFSVRVDGVEIAQLRRENVTNQLIYGSRHLEPGDYRIELVWSIAQNSFIKYNPGIVTMTPRIRTERDMNFRDFAPDELLVPDRRDVPLGPPLQWISW